MNDLMETKYDRTLQKSNLFHARIPRQSVFSSFGTTFSRANSSETSPTRALNASREMTRIAGSHVGVRPSILCIGFYRSVAFLIPLLLLSVYTSSKLERVASVAIT
jgi:hypothetical protein